MGARTARGPGERRVARRTITAASGADAMLSVASILLILERTLLAAGWAKTADKNALIAFYQATGGEYWVQSAGHFYNAYGTTPGGNLNWDTSGATDPCPYSFSDYWAGVMCVDPCYYPIDGDDCRLGRITGLSLPFNNLTGTIPDGTFDQLNNLTIVDLSHNSLSGTLPTTVGKLRNVMMFTLNDNLISGTVPEEIRTMGSHIAPDETAMALEDLPAEALANASLIGYPELLNITFPTAMETFGLQQFDVGSNRFTGNIPT